MHNLENLADTNPQVYFKLNCKITIMYVVVVLTIESRRDRFISKKSAAVNIGVLF